MDVLQTTVDIFASMDTGWVAALFVLVAIVLIWLIVRASRRGADSAEAAKRAQHNRYQRQPEARHGESPSPQSSAAGQPSASPEPPPESVAVAEIRAPEPAAKIPVEAVTPEPEDSVLHRHYEAELAARKEALAHPYPTDSVLRRHYDTLHTLHPDNRHAVTAPEKKDTRNASIIEQAINKDEQAGEPRVVETGAGNKAPKLQPPQDSVLKRHYIGQLQAEITAGLSPRPSDSVLRRHYDSMVQAELAKRLCG